MQSTQRTTVSTEQNASPRALLSKLRIVSARVYMDRMFPQRQDYHFPTPTFLAGAPSVD